MEKRVDMERKRVELERGWILIRTEGKKYRQRKKVVESVEIKEVVGRVREGEGERRLERDKGREGELDGD